MEETENKTEIIIKIYLDVVKEKKRLPTYADFLDVDISTSTIRHHFGNLTKLHSYIEIEHQDILSDVIAHENHLFSSKRFSELKDDIKKYKRFVITTAISGKAVFEPFLESIRNYCDKRNAMLLVLPAADIASRQTKTAWTFDPLLKGDFFVHKEIQLNNKFFISNIKLSAKQINPTTGLSRIGQRNGSYVFASPKQSLEIVATSAQKDRSAMALMTTGAITVPDYNTERYMSERTSYIAENDHIMGAIIVEIENNKVFHFRQLQSNSKGEFVDFGKRYFPNGDVKPEEAHFYAGDWHAGNTEMDVIDALDDMMDEIEIVDFMVGDFFDGNWSNHYDWNQPLKRVKKVIDKKNDLKEELLIGCMDINRILGKIFGSLVMIKGNHDERLEKWLAQAQYVNDDVNHYMALDLAKAYLEGKNVLKEAYLSCNRIESPERIIWLDRDEEFKVAGVECGQHGDLGANGSPGSLLSIEKAYGNCIVGHTHSPAILRGVYRVGTFSKLQLDYNRGPSSWMHTGCLIYNDGSRQLINFINGGSYRLKDD